MNSNEGIQVSVYTRWHQWSVPLAFALAAGSFMLVVFNRGPMGLAAGLALLGLLVPPLIAYKGFPTRNAVRVTADGLEFSRRSSVAFADLSSWGTDDYLKLVRAGLPTLLVSAVDLPSRDETAYCPRIGPRGRPTFPRADGPARIVHWTVRAAATRGPAIAPTPCSPPRR